MDAIDKLKAAVAKRTQAALGAEIGCGQGLLSRWLSGSIIPSGRYAKQLRRYGITADDLIALQAKRKPIRRKPRGKAAA